MKKINTQNTLVFLATYPPRECGIATFTHDLVKAIQTISNDSLKIKIAAFNHSQMDTHKYPHEVSWQISQENIDEYKTLAQELNNDGSIKTIIIQHEYGIFGGEVGSHLLEFLENIEKPVITVLHTVLSNPSEKMREVTQKIIEKSTKIIIMTEVSRKVLLELYSAQEEKFITIPHGIHPVIFRRSDQIKSFLGLEKHTVLSTFGLLNRGKGIENVLSSLPTVVEKNPDIIYLVLGETHPIVRRNEGESYRNELMDLVKELNLQKHVRFYDKYFALDDILKYLQATDIYLATTLDPEQSVSGTFSYALGSGRAVISTEFRQAKELLTQDIGRIIPVNNPQAFSDALIELLEGKTTQLYDMHQSAYRSTRTMLWNNVAHTYLELINKITELSHDWYLPELNLSHMKRMTDMFGILQFSDSEHPAKDFGYTLDDNARALLLCLQFSDSIEVGNLIETYFSFLNRCQLPTGQFINYLSGEKMEQTDQNWEEDLEDAFGRAIWAIGEVTINPKIDDQTKEKANSMLEKAMPHIKGIIHLRAFSFTLLGLLCWYQYKKDPRILELIENTISRIKKAYYQHAQDDWQWLEEKLAYANGILPYAIFKTFHIIDDKELYEIGLKIMDFLLKTCFLGEVYVPIGQKGWYHKNHYRAYFDQQPEDVGAMMMALTELHTISKDEKYSNYAKKCFSWFLGNNLLGACMYNHRTGGCHDGLTARGPNPNQGAESLIAYLQSRILFNKLIK